MDLAAYLTDLDREHEGAIPFRVFMEKALYDPEVGYYTANIEGVGGRGADFSTSATLMTDLARSIAAWIQVDLKRHRRNGPVIAHVVEIGPGDGTLLFNILRHLNRRVRRTLTFHLVEISPRLEALQRERLAKFGNIQWHREVTGALDAAAGHALVYSNELVDAFPATALQRTGEGHWEEICVSFSETDGLKEVLRPFDLSSVFSLSSCSKYEANQRVEIHQSYHEYLATWLPRLEAGSILTIDYGDTVEHLYERRPLGTLRAYWKQQRFEGPPEIYARFGKQDLTADVNFTDLADWGESHGLETVSLDTQAAFTGSSEPAAEAFRVLHQRTR